MFEFCCKYKGEEKKVFISNLKIYSGVTFEYDSDWSKGMYCLKLYYIKRYSDCDGFISVSTDCDSFSFSSREDCLKVYDDIKKRLVGNNVD